MEKIMANTISTQIILDGRYQTVTKVTIEGDGSGEETNTVIWDASGYTPVPVNNKLRKIIYLLNGFSGTLYWDATANVMLTELDDSLQEEVDYTWGDARYSGIPNNAGTGKTNDILITTVGLGAGDKGYIILYVDKSDIDNPR
jgi:hypothetical protein